MKKALQILTFIALPIAAHANPPTPDAYGLVLSNAQVQTFQDGCIDPTKDSNASFKALFDQLHNNMMMEYQNLLVLKSCHWQSIGFNCSIVFDSYDTQLKETGPSPFSFNFWVHKDLSLDAEHGVMCF
jgi:hypothetical protein